VARLTAVEHAIQQTKVKTMADFSFLELSYDPDVYPTEKISEQLIQLGFVHRSQHKIDYVGFWSHKECIFLLRKVSNNKTPYISGIGLLGTVQDIDNLNAEFDSTCDFFKLKNNFGLDTYIIQENQIDPNIVDSYKIVDATTPSIKAFNNFTGIKIKSLSDEIKNHFVSLGFTFNDVSNNYGKLTSPNKKFTLMCEKNSTADNLVQTLLIDTHDVFKATAYFVSNNLDIPKFNTEPQNNFGKLDFKINSYNCKAWGNENSYTIENFLKEPIEGIDIIFRQRKQYLHIQETTLDSYYINEQQ